MLQGLFPTNIIEGAKPVTEIVGTIPDFVRGTWIMNGPAQFHRGDLSYRHWLDGDGLLRAVQFSEDRVTFTCRWVRSRKRIDEEEAGRALYRTFGTTFPDDRLNQHGVGIESPVNVSIIPFAGRLLAFGEQGLPYSIGSDTLDTRGVHTFDGALNDVSPFSAHPSIDPKTGELVNFGISFSATRPCLNLYRFDREGQLRMRRRVPIPHPCSVHDFALGPRHAVVYLAPDQLNMEALLAGQTVMEALTWRPQDGSHLLVLDRDSGRQEALIPIGNRYCLHTVNCFEDNNQLVLDVLELEEPVYRQYQVMPDLFESVGAARPVRYRIDPTAWTIDEKHSIETTLLHDFPAIDPRRSQQSTVGSWMVGISATGRPGPKFFDRLVRVDWESNAITDTFQTPAGGLFVSEPVVVPHPSERTQCAVLCRMANPGNGDDHVLIFSGFDLQAGPVAALRLPLTTPPSFHGGWLP